MQKKRRRYVQFIVVNGGGVHGLKRLQVKKRAMTTYFILESQSRYLQSLSIYTSTIYNKQAYLHNV